MAFADALFPDSKSAFAAMGDVEQTARDIDYRLGFMSEYVLKQARWTVELALLDAVESGEIQASLERLRALADQLPASIAQQRDTFFASLASERAATLGTIDAQRIDTLTALGRERQAVFDGIDEQREAILVQLRAEREATMADLGVVVERSLMHVVDHAIWRLLELGLAAALVALPARWLWMRRQRSAA